MDFIPAELKPKESKGIIKSSRGLSKGLEPEFLLMNTIGEILNHDDICECLEQKINEKLSSFKALNEEDNEDRKKISQSFQKVAENMTVLNKSYWNDLFPNIETFLFDYFKFQTFGFFEN